MSVFPKYVGPAAFGVKMGVILPGTDLEQLVLDVVNHCNQDGLLDDGDVVCVTESVLARSQNNYVDVTRIAAEIRNKLGLNTDSRIGVVFPIASRNRFSMILEGIAQAVPDGEVVLQMMWPIDEVGNQIVSDKLVEEATSHKLVRDDWTGEDFLHPITKVNYIQLYKEIIEDQGTKATIFLSNDPKDIGDYQCDGVIAADIHTRGKTKKAVSEVVKNTITLQDLCSSQEEDSWSEWGLLGSNMSAGGRLKLAPQNASGFATSLQQRVKESFGKNVEIIVYGDGAYKDPSSGIYELADPKPVFGCTAGFSGLFREGVKYKYLADLAYNQGKSISEIEELLKEKQAEVYQQDQVETEGTTPRRLEDVIASLADLVSGSADAGTPVVVVKGFFR